MEFVQAGERFVRGLDDLRVFTERVGRAADEYDQSTGVDESVSSREMEHRRRRKILAQMN